VFVLIFQTDPTLKERYCGEFYCQGNVIADSSEKFCSGYRGCNPICATSFSASWDKCSDYNLVPTQKGHYLLK